MSIATADVVGALQLLAQTVLTAKQIAELLAKPEITEAEVLAQLDQTDAAIARAREDD